jgi:hypothetical protein
MVQRSRRLPIVVMITVLSGLVGLSGCHGASDGTYKLRFVSQADATKVLELTLRDPGVLARVHMSVFRGRIKGTYVLKDGDTKAEGRVTQDETGYTLFSEDGKKQKFKPEQEDAVKGEDGTVWKLENPTTVVVLKER